MLASFNMNRLHLERALEFLDPREYARFRHSLGGSDPGVSSRKAEDFGKIVTMRLNDYIQ